MPNQKPAATLWGLSMLLAAGCGTTDPPPPAGCDSPLTVSLAPGQHQVFDLTANGCYRLPASAGAVDEEYAVALVSGSGVVTESGVTGSYHIQVGPVGASAATATAAPTAPVREESAADRFHRRLRNQERELSADPANRPVQFRAPIAAPPPALGSERTFSVCQNLDCNAFNQVTATARYVGTHAVVYLDNTVPQTDPLTQEDLDELGATFDIWHHPIGTTAFGVESDLDANGLVAILLTDAVNALTPNCSNGRIIGYFYGGDLLNVTGSNRAEVFYGMVPAPQTTGCQAATRQGTVRALKGVLIHEFQHMISFNQHVLLRSGSAEETWLNEGLSHLAEELAGLQIPADQCPLPPNPPSCRSLYISSDLTLAYSYMENTEAEFVVFPDASSGTLEERGAVWLFVRWLVDQFGGADGTTVSRGLVQTNRTGAGNIEAVTGQPLSRLLAEWQLTNWVDDLPQFTPASARLAYTSWGLRDLYERNCCTPGAPFPNAYPLQPWFAAGSFSRSGTLRGGSGVHFRFVQGAGPSASDKDILVARSSGGPLLDASLVPRLAIVRIR